VRRWFQQATGGLPRQFWLLWTGTLINRLGAFVVILLAIYLTGERHFTQSQAGLVIGLYGVGGAVGTMTGGVLADRWGRRPTLLVAQFGAAALMMTLGFAHTYGQIIGATFLLGVFAEAARPAFSAMMIDVVPNADRLRAYSLNYWAINLGFAISAVGAGLAAQFDYLLVFAVDAGTTLVTALITLFFLTETRPARVAGSRSTPADQGGLGTVFRDRIFLVAFAAGAGFYALTVIIWTLGEMLQSPSNAVLIAELSPAALRGRYQGVNSLSWSAGAALAPITGGFVQEHLGNAALWLGCAAVGALVAAGQLLSGPARERRAASLRTSGAAAVPPAIPPPSAAEPVADVPPAEFEPSRAVARD
jgi:MFS family permease